MPFERVMAFFAMGMLINVAAAMDLPAVDERWTSWCPREPPAAAICPVAAPVPRQFFFDQ